MKLVVRTQMQPRPVVHAMGEIDLVTAPQLARHLAELIASGHHRIVVDLSAVEFVDSSAMAVFADTHIALIERGGQLALANPRPQAARVLHLCGLTEVIEVHDSIELALRDSS